MNIRALTMSQACSSHALPHLILITHLMRRVLLQGHNIVWFMYLASRARHGISYKLCHSVILEKLLNLSEFQFLHL